MKKILIVLLVIVCIGLGAGVIYIKGSEDNEGPKITFSEDKDTKYTSGMTTEDLLKDVRAQDNKDGDVTDSLTVETMYPKNDGKQITVIFVAKDKSNNVTKKEFTMEAEDGSAENPDLGLVDNEDLTDNADQAEKPDADSDTEDTSEEDSTDSSDDATDSTEGDLTPEEQAQKTEEDKIAQLSPQAPKLYLTSYVKDIQDDTETRSDLFKKIQITGDVNTATPGTYELTYYVVDNQGNSSNGAILTVVVK